MQVCLAHIGLLLVIAVLHIFFTLMTVVLLQQALVRNSEVTLSAVLPTRFAKISKYGKNVGLSEIIICLILLSYMIPHRICSRAEHILLEQLVRHVQVGLLNNRDREKEKLG